MPYLFSLLFFSSLGWSGSSALVQQTPFYNDTQKPLIMSMRTDDYEETYPESDDKEDSESDEDNETAEEED